DFATYDAAYFQTMVESLAPTKQAEFMFAMYQGRPIAGLLLARFGTTVYYLHGGSLYEQRALMAPHLLQWEALRYAKAHACSCDSWGVACEKPNRQEGAWAGVTRFKVGFAPQMSISEYPGTYELPINRGKYVLYRLRQMIKG